MLPKAHTQLGAADGTQMHPPEKQSDTRMFINHQGTMFVFEGQNGCGKSTALRSVAARLTDLGADVVVTREPGGTPAAEHIRQLLLDPAFDVDTHEQMLLLMAGRRNHLRTVILPALTRGAIVLCDRYVTSSIVYQTLREDGGLALTTDEVVSAHEQWCWGAAPELQFHFSLPAEIAVLRRDGRANMQDRFESENIAFERACADRYAESAALLGFRQHDIDATATPRQVADAIMTVLEPVALDQTWTPMVYRMTEDRSGRWFPLLDAKGRIIWSHEPAEAHRLAAAHSEENELAQFSFARRSVAVKALDNGLTTDELHANRL